MPSLPPVLFPVKGVNRTFAKSSQSEGTAYDMQNVLPFDLSGRLRGGQRPGTLKAISSVLADKIVLIDQVTTLTAATSGSTGTIFNDAFTYSNGQLDTVSSGAWTLFSGGPVLTVTSHTVGLTSSGGSGLSQASKSAGSVPTLPITLSIDFTLPADFYTFATGHEVLLQYQIDNSGSLLYCDVFKSGSQALLSITNENTSVTVNSGLLSLLTATPYTMTLQITGTMGLASLNFTGANVATPISSASSTLFYAFQIERNTSTNTIVVDNFGSTSTTSPGVPAHRLNSLIAVAGGNIYSGTISSLPLATGGAATLDSTVYPQMAFSLGKAYFVDGTSLIQMDVKTNTVEAYTVPMGKGTAPTGCTLACTYRDRLVLAAPYPDTQNFFCSRVGDQHDWDYGAGDPAQAFAGNASVSGRIGEPITALIPASDDCLYLGGDHNLYVIRGDPADGGSIDMVSDAIGVLGPDAWAKAPNGAIYFVGSGGFYRLPAGAGSQPEPVSLDKWTQFFATINRNDFRITMAWDRDNHGCFIFLMPTAGTVPAVCLWYDERTDGFFPQAFPLSHGPFSTFVFDGDGPADRILLLGGTDGYLRKTSQSAVDDDGTAISSYVVMGPWPIGDTIHDGVLESVDIVFGDAAPLNTTFWGVITTVRTGKDALSVTDGTPQHTFTKDFGQLVGNVGAIRRRARGAWCSVKLSNTVLDKTWNFESLTLTVTPGGRTRR